ncbi:MAG: hypothetical protein GXO43_08355 [Crenarchaeota archaeon]|nr:hypothetical protein [Thermoproteota archaeon]
MGENREEEQVERRIRALSHWARRRIILLLGDKGPMTYSELMKNVGIEDSGTFAFHLKSLGDLVEKTSDGKYKLSREGEKVYKALKYLISGEEPVQEEKPRINRELPPIIIGEMGKCYVTKEIVDEAYSSGRELIVSECIKAYFDKDIDPEKLRKVLKRVSEVLIVEAPKHLEPIILSRSKEVFWVRTIHDKHAPPPNIGLVLEDIVNKIVDAAVQGSAKLVGALQKLPQITAREIPVNIVKAYNGTEYDLEMKIDSSSISAKQEGGGIVITGKTKQEGMPRISISDNSIYMRIEDSGLKVKLPDLPVTSLRLYADSSSLKLDLKKLSGPSEIVLDSCNARLLLNAEKKFSGSFEIDSSNALLDLSLPEGYKHEIDLKIDSSNIRLVLRIPRGMKIYTLTSLDSSIFSGNKPVAMGMPGETENCVILRIRSDSSIIKYEIIEK